MESLRKPFFVAAMILILLVVLVEVGAGFFIHPRKSKPGEVLSSALAMKGMQEQLKDLQPDSANLDDAGKRPPGIGVPSMAFLDGLLLFTIGLMGAQFVWGERIHGRFQGVIALVVSLLVLLALIVAIFVALAKVLIMIALFLAVPFGTLAYLAMWGFFNIKGAAAALGLILLLKLGGCVCLILAQQQFVKYKALVLIILTSFVANLIISFLHALVPSILVSITDGIGAIVVMILAAIWAIYYLIGSVGSILAVIKGTVL